MAYDIPSSAVEQTHQIARVRIVELPPRFFIEHVGIEPVGAQQRHMLFFVGALDFEPGELRRQRSGFLIQLDAGVEAVAAGIGINAELGDETGRDRIEREAGQNRLESCARDHALHDAPSGLMPR